jgi:ABC-type antimicrobial peptide transport system permease subunit
MPKLVKLALSNWRRQRVRTAFTLTALTLSAAAVVFVYALSIAFQATGSKALENALAGSDLWIVPPGGVTFDRADQKILPNGSVPGDLAERVRSLPGVTEVSSGRGWLNVKADDPRAVAEELRGVGLTVTGDPSRTRADAGAPALAYLVSRSSGRFAAYSFTTGFEAVQVNKVTASVLGVVGRVTLALGFLSVVASLLISIEERRHEFGILAAVGITDDVLYLFLVESAMIICTGLVLGLVAGAGLFALLLPSLFEIGTVLKAVGLVSVYFPIMLIFGALIPAHRLLQRTPLELLRGAH